MLQERFGFGSDFIWNPDPDPQPYQYTCTAVHITILFLNSAGVSIDYFSLQSVCNVCTFVTICFFLFLHQKFLRNELHFTLFWYPTTTTHKRKNYFICFFCSHKSKKKKFYMISKKTISARVRMKIFLIKGKTFKTF